MGHGQKGKGGNAASFVEQDIMGLSLDGEQYGQGLDLSSKLAVLERIAFPFARA